MEIITRIKAIELGLTRYFTGKPCKSGHICQRLISSNGCIECMRISYKKWSEAHPEKVREKNRKRIRKGRNSSSEYNRLWKMKNKDKVREQKKRYRKKHPLTPEAKRLKRKRYYERHPDKKLLIFKNLKKKYRKICNSNRKARLKGGNGRHTKKEIDLLLKKQKSKCANCFISVKNGYDVDHITPLSRGGSNFISNIQILCGSCNRRKNAKDPIEFARQNGRLL